MCNKPVEVVLIYMRIKLKCTCAEFKLVRIICQNSRVFTPLTNVKAVSVNICYEYSVLLIILASLVYMVNIYGLT